MCFVGSCIDWQGKAFLDKELLEVHGRRHSMEAAYHELQGVHLCGTKQSLSYCGIENSALPSLRLQVPCFDSLGAINLSLMLGHTILHNKFPTSSISYPDLFVMFA